MTEHLRPIKKAAQRLGISVWTLRKKAYEGEVASVKIGAKLLVPESEIARIIREGLRPRREIAQGRMTHYEKGLGDSAVLAPNAAESAEPRFPLSKECG